VPLNTALLGELRGDFDENVRSLLANSFDSVGQIAFVEMLKQAAIIQMKIEFRIGLVGRL
jgi:hypothetical protein